MYSLVDKAYYVEGFNYKLECSHNQKCYIVVMNNKRFDDHTTDCNNQTKVIEIFSLYDISSKLVRCHLGKTSFIALKSK